MPVQPIKEREDRNLAATLLGRHSHVRVNLLVGENLEHRLFLAFRKIEVVEALNTGEKA